jgi:hypothetical protein
VHAVHSMGATTSTKSAAPDPPRWQRPAPCYDGGMDKDKDDEPKPVADYWIKSRLQKTPARPERYNHPRRRERYSDPHGREARRDEGRPAEVTSILVAGVARFHGPTWRPTYSRP